MPKAIRNEAAWLGRSGASSMEEGKTGCHLNDRSLKGAKVLYRCKGEVLGGIKLQGK